MQELVDLIARYGLALIFINVLVEQVGLPVPAVPTLIVAGAAAAAGEISAAAVFGVAVLACFIGDGLWFAGGRLYGPRGMRLPFPLSPQPGSCGRPSEDHLGRRGKAPPAPSPWTRRNSTRGCGSCRRIATSSSTAPARTKPRRRRWRRS